MKQLFFLFVFVQLSLSMTAQQKIYSIVSYGATPGKALNTVAIQSAIDAASKAGGGIVLVPKGIFITGTLELKSNVELHIDSGAVLQGSDLRKDYDGFSHLALLIAIKQNHIAVTGSGTIDGRGRELMQDITKRLQEGTLQDADWKVKRPREASRASVIYFEACENISVKQVFIKDASSWVTHYERCRNIVIDHIKLVSTAYWNNDGVDIVDCKNVRITHSFINSADDAICLKSSGEQDYCDSIYVSDCTLRSSANAFKLGTSSKGGFKNITVRNLTIYDTYRSAIALEAVDGGFLQNVDIQNVKAKNTGNAIFIKLGHRNTDDRYSTIKNIFISDVQVSIPVSKPDAGYEMEGPLLKYPPGFVQDKNKIVSVSPWNKSGKDSNEVIYRHNVFPSSVSGLPGHAVENVQLQNIAISYKTIADKQVNFMPLDSFHIITEATKDYPEFSMFGELPVWGFFLRHVQGLTMKNITVKMEGKDFRQAFLFEDVKKLLQQNITIAGAVKKPAIFYNNVEKQVEKK